MIWKTVGHNKSASIIKNIPLFSELSDEEIELIEHIIIKKNYAKDQIVLFEEDTGNYMYIVYSGMVRVVKQSLEGREQIITIHKKSGFFGEMSLLDGKTAPATIIAHEDAVIGLLSKDDFEKHLLSNETIGRKIIDLLCAQLRDSWAMIKILSFDNAEHRIMAVLERMHELYGMVDDRGGIINVKLTHQQIANYASVTRETATRVLNRLEKEAAIQVLDGKTILLTKKFFELTKTIG
ncbi:MAG: Crp/Fnr family transcriptional regulator [Geobacteraceae bacterium]|nr:Crp/Fnr family transcriptional regulator [Geobacteraceae bacterium]NTW80776.1 Crp/Fnr family transcriptional regulator [Geobacteraceae bacterium]